MGSVQIILLVVVAALLLLATNRWATQQKRELENLEPPPSLGSVGTWEDEVLRAEAAAAGSTEASASPPEGEGRDGSDGSDGPHDTHDTHDPDEAGPAAPQR